MLTDKAKEKFEEWYLLGYSNEENYLNVKLGNSVLESFYKLPLVCQQALIVEFIKALNYHIIVLPYATIFDLGNDLVGMDGTYSYFLYEGRKYIEDGVDFLDSSEALTKAIEKANNLINLK